MHEQHSSQAWEYERIFHREDPVWQQEKKRMEEGMMEALCCKDVLEINCGTGYWTERASFAAKRIIGTDRSVRSLEIARAKQLSPDKVRFELADAYNLASLPGWYNAGLANFWLTRVPPDKIRLFLDQFHLRLGPGATVFMADHIASSKCPPLEELQQTFGADSLHGCKSKYELEDRLLDYFEPYAREIKIHAGDSCWWLSYKAV
ncbi:class I SAM-dependent methyltransferase [Paenibacillus koleovorans]|uniref:class I SAM-dependent methyltransferase n=1 Tax=Paenibacillus koleovorans TaxID=121608 RepID=UPI0013E35026|nr:class I SAM-dependent methyltransferase [Paenibacillus koleovorans]